MRTGTLAALTALMVALLAGCSQGDQKAAGTNYTPDGGKSAMEKSEEQGAANPEASTAEGP